MIANILTVSRIPFSLLLFVFPPDTRLFAVFYILCGLTDILDGFLARKLHTESEKGALLDSAADLVFALVYIAVILQRLFLPVWIWVWTAVIAAVKIFCIAAASIRKKKLFIRHSPLNKLTGLLIFLLPLTVCFTDVKYGAVPVCISATAAAADEIFKLRRNK